MQLGVGDLAIVFVGEAFNGRETVRVRIMLGHFVLFQTVRFGSGLRMHKN